MEKGGDDGEWGGGIRESRKLEISMGIASCQLVGHRWFCLVACFFPLVLLIHIK